MKIKLLLTLLLMINLGATATASSDNMGQVTTTVVDSELATLPVAGAIVELRKQGDSTGSLYYSTDGDGAFAIPVLNYGNYEIHVSFLGYETKVVDFTLNTPELELPTIRLASSSVQMEAVVKEIKALRSSQSGDSLQYNASAYKVANDADVEGLLQKMPGITIEDGTVTAQGETITKIYIDGREFFGGDVATALKSLPAEVVDRIELFNKLSDEAEFTGMDDGSGSKTINIITKPEMREGIFGKIFAGVGYEPNPVEDASEVKYMGGGSLNIFKGQSRTSVIALVNNLNQQNFSFEDIMGATDEGSSTGEFTIKALPGVAKVNAVGINYSNSYGEDERLKIQGSYFFNQTATDNTANTRRWYEEPATETIDSLSQAAASSTFNTNNRLTGRIDFKINDRQSIMIRPTLSYQLTEPVYSTTGMRYDNSNTNYDNGVQLFSNTKSSHWSGYYIGAIGNYRLRLNDNGRSMTAGFNGWVNNYDSNAETSTDPNIPNTSDAVTTYTFEDTPTDKRFLSGNVTFIEPLTERSRLTLSYRVSNTYQESDKRTYDTDGDYVVVDPETTKTTTYAESDYTTHSAGAGVKFYVGEKGSVTATGYYQSSTFGVNTLRTKDSKDPNPYEGSTGYQNATYAVVAKVRIDSGNSLRFYLNGYTTAPPIWKFSDNTTSTSSVTAGNSNLKPIYNHRLRGYYTRTSIEKGSTLMFNCNATMSTNYIGSHIVLDLDMSEILEDDAYDEVQQYTGYVNLDKSYYKLDSNISYGMPVDFIKCNLNFNAGISYISTPSMYGGTVVDMGEVIGGENVTTESTTYRGGLTLGSNISEKVDFTLAWRGDYSAASNAYEGATTANNYFNQSASAYMKFTVLGGFTITNNIAYKQYMGFTNDYNDRYILLNAFVGHKVMAKDRGEITFGVNDILNQNTSIVRKVASNYTQNVVNSITGRYFSIQFIYNLRAFGIFGGRKDKPQDTI
ncbi:MAG: carboxypeptidase-like regulatory domain-containing protein [Rikenellaceae bacterium]